MPNRSPALSLDSAPAEEPKLPETLKRFSPATVAAARIFRQTGNPRYLPAIVHGILERHVDRELQGKLEDARADPRLAEDLGIDSLTLMEIAIALEDAVGFPLDHAELRPLLTVGEIERVLAAKARRSS